MVLVSYLVHYDILLQNATDIITKYVQNMTFLLRNATVITNALILLQNATVATPIIKCVGTVLT